MDLSPKSRGGLRIVVLDDIHRRWAKTAGIAKLRRDVDIFTDIARSRSTLLKRLHGAHIVIANRERTHFTADVFGNLSSLELICNTGAHAAHIDALAAKATGVRVMLAPGRNPRISGRSTTELAIALMQAVMRRIPHSGREIRHGIWRQPVGKVLDGKTLGIVGLGRVGSQVARLARAFGMNVLAWNPTLTRARARRSGTEYRELDRLLAEADVVTIHAVLTPKTRWLIDARRLTFTSSQAPRSDSARRRHPRAPRPT
jgi:phosphoglycerate dehydrogenase-like enzyme